MKKILNISFGLLAVLAVSVSCNKVNTDTPNGNTPVSDEGKIITIKATLSNALTKVSFDVNYGTGSTPTGISHKWQDGDILRISNGTDSEDYTLVDGIGKASGTFQGKAIEGSSFTVTVVPQGEFDADNNQEQAKDGDTAHLKYVASATNVTDLSNITLSESSSIIGIIAKLPKDVAVTVDKLVIETSIDNFQTRNTLTINLKAQEDIDTDDILKVYANVPTGWSIPDNTKMLLKFGSKNASHTVYTRYQEFPSGATINPGKFNYLKLNCSKIDKYAGGADAGTATAPYLIADPFQLLAMDGLLATEKRYFKLLCNIDMDGVAISKLINKDSPYKPFDFDGNSKTITNLGRALFYIIKDGSVKDLTLEGSDVPERGALAEYIQGTGNVVSNVTVSNGKVNSSSSNVGGLVGRINSGSGTCATITNCIISNTTVNGAGNVGGVIGYVEAIVDVSGCSFSGTSVTASGQYVGGFVGQIGNSASTFSGCSVEGATINANQASDPRGGGFAGIVYNEVTVKGCTVGTSTNKVVIKTKQPASNNVLNVGGFAGVNYGTITKNGDNRNKAYVNITSENTLGQPLNIGGFVGYHTGSIEYSDAVVDMSDLQGQVIGGFVGTTPSNSAIIDNCTVAGDVKGNNYTGMFIGKVDKAAIITNNTAEGTVSGQSSVGGFVGYCENNPTFTDNTTSATTKSNGSNVGGFVGAIESATMTRCSATGKVEKLSSTSNDYGGFAGYTNNATLDGCYSKGTVDVDVAQTETVGGFIGQVMPATGNLTKIDNCYSESNVEGSGRWTGGFIGYIYKASDNCGDVEITKCHASGDVSVTGKNYVAGFIGRTYMVSGSHLYIDKCYATGNVSSTGSGASAFIGEIGEATNCSITDCFSTGKITGNGQQRGGLIAIVNANANTTVTISRCYSSSEVNGSFRLGGLIGNINNAKVTVEDCAAWNSGVIASSVGPGNWSSGAVVGTAFPTCTLTDNYRKPSMPVKAFWGNVSGTPGTDGYTWELTPDYNHPNVSSSSPLTICEKSASTFTLRATTATALASGQDNYPIFPYHGLVEAGKTLSQLASTTLGWSSDIWDFSDELPTLK